MQSSESETGVWAIVTSPGGKKYIGQIVRIYFIDNYNDDGVDDDGMAALGGVATNMRIIEAICLRWPVLISPAYGFTEAALPINQGGRTAFTRLVQVLPVDNCLEGAKIHTLVDTVHFFEDMTEEDRSGHKRLVEDVASQLMQARAERAGLTLAKTRS